MTSTCTSNASTLQPNHQFCTKDITQLML
jgi:hypothetical protein